MANIRMMDMPLIEGLFDMGSGYVLDFSNATFSQFFSSELNVNIDDPAYAVNGGSKAKRLRAFLMAVEPEMAAKALLALWEYREAVRQGAGKEDPVPNSEARLKALVGRLQGKPLEDAPQPIPVRGKVDPKVFDDLKSELMSLASLAPQPRGYAFEKFLKKLFDAFDLAGRDPFRMKGEQIDGSFQLDGETYLVEAKWHGKPIGVAELHAFHGKLDQKAAWTRGLFISESGFSDDGLAAFGRGKRVICMDGLDLYEMLNRRIPLDEVLAKKVRHASETGVLLCRVRDF